ncbi:MAG: glycosyltransferase family 39 protein [Chitinophagaceae bacterium]
MQKTNRIIFLLAIIKFILPYLLQNSYYEPHRDEFLYLAEGQHLAWGYMEIPPLLSVFAWLTHLFGNTMFWIKFWPDLFGAFTFIITAKIIQSLGGKSFAIFLAFLPFVFGVYLRLFFLFQPNTPEVFFWTMIAFSIIRFIQTEKNKWLYIFGISVGLGMISKYSVAFFVVSILIGLMLTPQRKIFLNRHLYFAVIIAVLIFLPTLLWEYNHHFPVIVHMKELQKKQLQYVSHIGFLMDQLLMNLPCVFIWLAGLYFCAFAIQGKNYRVFAWAYVFAIVLLLILQGKNYYALGVYPVLFAFGAYHLESFAAPRYKVWKYVFVIIPFLFGIPFIPMMLPVEKPAALAEYYQKYGIGKTGILKWEDLENHPLPQDFADMLSWKEMTEKVAKAYNNLDSNEKKHTILFCDNYGEAGAVNFYGKKYYLPDAYSDNGSFLYWMPRYQHINNIVLVTDDKEEMQHPFIKDFVSAVAVDSITNIYAREHGTLIIVLKGANETFNKMFREKIDAKYAEFK